MGIGDQTITQATGPKEVVAKITANMKVETIAEANMAVEEVIAREATTTEVPLVSITKAADSPRVGLLGRIRDTLRAAIQRRNSVFQYECSRFCLQSASVKPVSPTL